MLPRANAALEHHGLRVSSDDAKLDEPLEQVGNGLSAESFGVHSEQSGQVAPEDVLTSRDIYFIKECIHASDGPLSGRDDFIGRCKKKEFLYDIVSNRHSGLDVDKMDYFARDMKRTIGSGQVDFVLIEEAFVAKGQCGQGIMPGNPKKSCSHCYRQGRVLDHFMLCWPEKLVCKVRATARASDRTSIYSSASIVVQWKR